MSLRDDSLSPVGGRRTIIALGALYIALAAGLPFSPVLQDQPLQVNLVIAILSGVPGFVLLYGGYRLPRTGLRPELYPAIVRWCLGGVGVVLGVLVLIALASGLDSIVPNAVILTALGSVAGFAAGVHDARAKTRQLELQETVQRLKTSNERLEQFAYAASHDLQEPLRMVSTYLQLIEQRYGDDLDADGEEFIEFAVDGADRMREMVEGLLEYSRVESRGDPFEPVDLDRVLADVREDLRMRIEESNAELTAESLPRVEGDEQQLRQVFQNLLGNAIEYSGDDPPRIDISAERNGGKWVVSVRDEGIGIDPGDADRVFEVFQSLHAPNDYSGTGIGLALCERIVERHGGDTWVDSEPGEESVFSFTLPADGGHDG